MKINKLIAIAILAIMLVPCGIVFADTVEGTASNVDLDANKIEVATKNATTGAEEKVTVSITDKTTFTGDAASLAEVIEGDAVKLEVTKDEAAGTLSATSAAVTFAEEETV